MTWEHWIALVSVLAPLVRAMLELSRIRRDMDRVLGVIEDLRQSEARCDERADAADGIELRVRRLESIAMAKAEGA